MIEHYHRLDTTFYLPTGIAAESPSGEYPNIDRIARPDAFDRLARLVIALNSGNSNTRETLRTYFSQSNLADRLRALFMPEDLSEYTRRKVREIIDRVLTLDMPPPRNPKPVIGWPESQLLGPDFRVANDIRDQRMIIIGDGPAALLLARQRQAMGYDYQATTIVSARGKELGGIWHYRNVVGEGHNTVVRAKAFGSVLSAQEPRPGTHLQGFLKDLADPLRTTVHHGKAIRATFDSATRLYRVSTVNDKNLATLEAESVCIATGNALPRVMGKHVFTHTRIEKGLPVKRWQEMIAPEKWSSFDNTTPVIIGLGNSAMAMWHVFAEMRKTGINVNPVIITHHTAFALRTPSVAIFNHKKNAFEGQLSRHASGLSGLALDIPRIRSRYIEALDKGAIISNVKAITTRPSDGLWSVTTTHDARPRTRNTFTRVPVIYLLIGYQNDPETMTNLGCTVSNDGTVIYDPITHTVAPADVDPNNDRMYVLGKAAYTPKSRSAETIPGMMGAIPSIAAADLVRGLAAKERQLAQR